MEMALGKALLLGVQLGRDRSDLRTGADSLLSAIAQDKRRLGLKFPLPFAALDYVLFLRGSESLL